MEAVVPWSMRVETFFVVNLLPGQRLVAFGLQMIIIALAYMGFRLLKWGLAQKSIWVELAMFVLWELIYTLNLGIGIQIVSMYQEWKDLGNTSMWNTSPGKKRWKGMTINHYKRKLALEQEIVRHRVIDVPTFPEVFIRPLLDPRLPIYELQTYVLDLVGGLPPTMQKTHGRLWFGRV